MKEANQWSAFVAKQGEIYGNFSKGAVIALKEGVKPDSILSEKKGGYALVLRPAEEIVRLASDFAHDLALNIPGTYAYRQGQLHTTLFDYRVAAGFISDGANDHEEVLSKLSGAAKLTAKYVRQQKNQLLAMYGPYGFNQTAAILKGFANEEFLSTATHAVSVAAKMGMEVKLPWGSHVTVARFGKTVSADKVFVLSDVLIWHNAIMAGRRSLASPFTSVDACWFTSSIEEGFNLRTVESFAL